jgi:hypothetical protein
MLTCVARARRDASRASHASFEKATPSEGRGGDPGASRVPAWCAATVICSEPGSPVLGVALLSLAIVPNGLALLAAIPAGGLGGLLFVAST